MSLVNDALKRATEKHNRLPPAPAPDLQLRPVEPASQNKKGFGLVLPATVVTIILAAIFSLRSTKHAPPTDPTPPTQPSSSPAPHAQPPAAPASESGPTIISSGPLVVMARENPGVSQSASVPAPSTPPVAPAPLKLQAVFFTPPRPAAIISGKTVRVGDSVRGFRVMAIGSSSALLISASQTNFLTLE